MQYFLPSHVYFCLANDAVIFLDLHRDKYFVVREREASSLVSFISNDTDKNSPNFAETRTERVSADTQQHALNSFVSAGLLTKSQGDSKPIVPTTMQRPSERLLDGHSEHQRIRINHILQFSFACITAAFRLRFHTIEKTVKTVSQRRAARHVPITYDFNRARSLVVVFNRLRSAFPTNYLCLFDSLALIEFLAKNELFPEWVFAVSPDPWGAHCWVQEGHVLFNDDLEEIDHCVPIMVI